MTHQTQVPPPSHNPTEVSFDVEKHRRRITRTISRRSFCTLATTSPSNHSHAAGVVYAFANGALWVHAKKTSRKARSVAANPNVGVCIPFRRLPMGPPYTIHFQGTAEIVAMNDDEVVGLLEAGVLKKIAGHGALEMPDGCFLKIQTTGAVHSFGPGAKILDLIRDPLNTGGRTVTSVHDRGNRS